jgi:NAD(P)H-dependent flavin oxidoreductase YrpB (nitropropane dioxygenase family)
MLRTPLCDHLGIEFPIILAPMGSATSGECEAVSNVGGLGGIGSLFRITAAIQRAAQLLSASLTLSSRSLSGAGLRAGALSRA